MRKKLIEQLEKKECQPVSLYTAIKQHHLTTNNNPIKPSHYLRQCVGSMIQSFILIFSLFAAYKRECMTDQDVSPSPSTESPVSTEPPTMEHICRASRDTCRSWGVDSQYFNKSCYTKLFGVIHACYPICKPGAALDHVDECRHYCRSK